MPRCTPTISIVIRNRNEAEQLQWVFKALEQQEYKGYEIILVDNNSTDNSLELAKEYKVRVVILDNFTYGRGLNKGIEAATGEIIVILSAHSVPLGRYFLSECARALMDETVGAARLIYAGKGSDIKRWLNVEYLNSPEQDFVSKGPLASGCVISKRAWRDVKFDEDLIAAEEKVWTHEILKKGYRVISPVPAFYYYSKRMSRRNELYKNYRELIAINQAFKMKVGFVKKGLTSVLPDFCKGIFSSVLSLFGDIQMEITKAYLKLKFPKL